MQKSGWVLAALVLLGTAAFGGDQPLTVVERLAIANKVLAATPDGAQHWTVLESGVVRHNASGLVCGADISTMPLVMLETRKDSPVADGSVDCRYASEDGNAVYDVLAFSPGKAISGQAAFDSYRAALLLAHPEAKSLMTFPGVNDPEARGEAFIITVNGKRHLSFLATGAVKEWVVAVRFTAAALADDESDEIINQMATWLKRFPQAVLYRGMRGVVVKQLSMPEPKDGF